MRPVDRPKKIKVKDLKVGMYVQLPGNWTQHSFIRNKFLIKNSSQLARIVNSGLAVVVIDPLKSRVRPDIVKKPNYVRKPTPKKQPELDLGPPLMPAGFSEFLVDATVTPRRKASHLYEVCLHVMDKVLKSPNAGNITQLKAGISDIVDLLLSDKETASNLFQITSHDHYTFTHSVNVGVISTLLTNSLYGESTPHDLRELSAAFFMHDLGKSAIPEKLLYLPDEYDDHERAIMQEHPMNGYQILSDTDHITPESKIVITQHHEREDGSGYPQGLQGDEIHVYSRICAIADVFDALTSRRFYKPSLSLYDALVLMKFDMGTRLNTEVFSEFIQLFKQ